VRRGRDVLNGKNEEKSKIIMLLLIWRCMKNFPLKNGLGEIHTTHPKT